MCDGEVDLARVGALHGIDAAAYFAPELDALSRIADLARYIPEAQLVRTSALGRMLVRNVCMIFDRYQQTYVPRDDAPRFSPTI
jgi:oxygen-independent coproporphyrinogen-3 oxidase